MACTNLQIVCATMNVSAVQQCGDVNVMGPEISCVTDKISARWLSPVQMLLKNQNNKSNWKRQYYWTCGRVINVCA